MKFFNFLIIYRILVNIKTKNSFKLNLKKIDFMIVFTFLWLIRVFIELFFFIYVIIKANNDNDKNRKTERGNSIALRN